MIVETSSGLKYVLDNSFAEGGEAAIWSINGHPQSVAKIFHSPSAAHQDKLETMLAYPPVKGEKLAVAWPNELLFCKGQFVGYQMPKVSASIPIFHFYNPARRASLDALYRPNYPWPYVLHHVAKNLAAAVKQIHAGGHVIGDLNESNVLVDNRAIVTLVDADSFQIRGELIEKARRWPFGTKTEQEIHHNVVGKAEFTAPELQGADFKSVVRTPEHDHFALSVLIFYLLMEGYHPYAGVMRNGESVGRVDLHCMREGVFPYDANLTAAPPPRASNYSWLHPDIRKAFRRAFVQGHNSPGRRPSADHWLNILRETGPAQVSCSVDQNHIYYSHLSICPTCHPDTTDSALVDRQKLAHWFWLTRRNTGVLVGILWAWFVAGLKKSGTASAAALSDATHSAAERGGRFTRNVTKIGTFARRKPKWRVRDLADRPIRAFAKQRGSQSWMRLWLKWAWSTVLGTVCGALLAMGIITAVDATGLPVSPLSQALLICVLAGLGMGLSQQPILRSEASTLRPHDAQRTGLGWSTGTSIVFLFCGAVGETVFELSGLLGNPEGNGRNLVYWALCLGLSIGFVQSLWLARYLERGHDQRRWTFVNGVGWVLVAYAFVYGRAWGLGQSAEWYGAITGAALGLLCYGLLTGLLFAWLARGPLARGSNHAAGIFGKRGSYDWHSDSGWRPQEWMRMMSLRWAKMLGLLVGALFAIEQWLR